MIQMEPYVFRMLFQPLEKHRPVAAVVPPGELQLSILESKPVDSLLLCWEVAFESGEGAVIWEGPAEDLWTLWTCCAHAVAMRMKS